MTEIKSKQGTQIVEVTKTSAGVKIKTVESKTHRSFTVHVFDECISGLIGALLECRRDYLRHESYPEKCLCPADGHSELCPIHRVNSSPR